MSEYVKVEVRVQDLPPRTAELLGVIKSLAMPIAHSLSPTTTHGDAHEVIESAILLGTELGLAIAGQYPVGGNGLLLEIERLVSPPSDLEDRRERRDAWVESVITSERSMRN